MIVCGIAGFRNDTPYSVGRQYRDILSAQVMINNDRIFGNVAKMCSSSTGSTAISSPDLFRWDFDMCMVCGTFLEDLFAKGLLFDMGVDGLYGRGGTFEHVVEGFTALITRFGRVANPEVLRFPPGMNRRDFERSGYLKNFPDMAGTIHSFSGGRQGARDAPRSFARQTSTGRRIRP